MDDVSTHPNETSLFKKLLENDDDTSRIKNDKEENNNENEIDNKKKKENKDDKIDIEDVYEKKEVELEVEKMIDIGKLSLQIPGILCEVASSIGGMHVQQNATEISVLTSVSRRSSAGSQNRVGQVRSTER